MAKYKSKDGDTLVDAFKYIPGCVLPEWFIGGEFGLPVDETGSPILIANTTTGKMIIRPGQWVVKEIVKQFPSFFEREFVEMNGDAIE